MAGPYSGNVLRQAAGPDDSPQTFYPDPAHAATGGHADGPARPGMDAHQVPATMGTEYDGSAFPVDQVVGGGFLLNTPSWADHDGPGDFSPAYTDDQVRERIRAPHDGSRDHGWLRKYEPADLQDAETVYGEEHWPGQDQASNPNREGSPALMRGINSFAVNNPARAGYDGGGGGWRLGLNRYKTVQRSSPRYPAPRVYGFQPLDDRRQYVPAQQQAEPSASASNRDRFPLFAPPGLFRNTTSPALAREPAAFDDAELAVDPSTDGQSLVIGGDL